MKPLPLWKPGLAWLLVLGPLFFLSYGFANHQAAGTAGVPSIVFDWERHIPLWPWTILPYWSIDFFYGLSLLICTTRLELTRHGLRLLTAQVLLQQTPEPTDAEIRDHLSGNVCRCTGYAGIVASVQEAARLLREQAS